MHIDHSRENICTNRENAVLLSILVRQQKTHTCHQIHYLTSTIIYDLLLSLTGKRANGLTGKPANRLTG